MCNENWYRQKVSERSWIIFMDPANKKKKKIEYIH